MANEEVIVPEEVEETVAPETPATTEVEEVVPETVEAVKFDEDLPNKEVSQPTEEVALPAPPPVEEVRNPDLVYFIWKGFTDTLDLPDGTLINKKKPVGVSKEVANNLLSTYYYAKDLEVV